ncbi:MAG: DUF2848 family protein [Nitrososphaerales archaeon]
MSKTIRLTLIEREGSRDIDFTVRQLFCGGFTGRNQDAVKKHIEEMASVGIPPPERTPALYRISPYLITSDDEVEVVGDKTSGEVEPVLLLGLGEMYLTVGSDQTDREVERLSYPKSKQICSKVIAKQVWRYGEVKDHYDDLILRSEVEKDEQKYLYQEGSVSIVMNPFDLLSLYDIGKDGTALFSGTIPTETERLIYADRYRIELIDPVLDRRIVHTYGVKVI